MRIAEGFAGMRGDAGNAAPEVVPLAAGQSASLRTPGPVPVYRRGRLLGAYETQVNEAAGRFRPLHPSARAVGGMIRSLSGRLYRSQPAVACCLVRHLTPVQGNPILTIHNTNKRSALILCVGGGTQSNSASHLTSPARMRKVKNRKKQHITRIGAVPYSNSVQTKRRFNVHVP